MDSTTSDSQPQLQQPSQQPQAQQQQQAKPPQQPHQQQQPHQPPPPPQTHQHPHPHHPHSHQHQPAQQGPYTQIQPPYQPNTFYHRAFTPSYPYSYHLHNHVPNAYAWNAPNYHPATAQSLSSIVQQQPSSNVPLHAKPSSQIINPGMNLDARTHNHGLPQMTVTNQSTPVIARQRRPATLKDPDTKRVLPLGDDAASTAKSSSSSFTKQSSNTLTITSAANSGEHVHTLLQKVSEDNNSEVENRILEKNNINENGDSSTRKDPEPQTTTISTTTTTTTTTTNSASATTTTTTTTTNDTTTNIETNENIDDSTPNGQELSEPVKVNEVKENGDDNSLSNGQEPKPTTVEENDVVDSSNSEEPKSVPDSVVADADPVVTDVKENGGDSSPDGQESEPAEAGLEYEPEQYNPISNRTGRRVYSRQFLLDVCEKVCKLDLTQKEGDERIGIDGSHLPSGLGEKFDMFAPSYSSNNQRYAAMNRQNEPPRRQAQHNYTGRSSAGQEKTRKIISTPSLTQEVELKTSSNPWRPAKDKEDTTGSGPGAGNDEAETESLKKKFRSILNKLTPNNFDNLALSVTELNINTEAKLGEMIDIVFAKALSEPGYCVLYGQMCSHLKKITAGAANFANTLLKRCQQQFQSDIYSGLSIEERKEKIEKEEDPKIKKHLEEELYEDMFRCRMRGLGLIKFIGELYKIEMLNDTIMFDCVHRLLGDTSEESLECLCDLLTTIGEKLDRSSKINAEKDKKVPKSASKANAYQGGQKSAAAVVASGSTSSQQQKALEQHQRFTTLDPCFEQLHKIRKNNKDIPLRIKFKIQDTCELRERDNWQSKKTKDNNPKKIEEIREAHKEKLEQERKQQNAMGPRRSQEGRRGLGHSSGSSSQISSLANESSGNRNQSGLHTSSSSHLLRDHSIGDNTKSNHNDIEQQKEHQRVLENYKNLRKVSTKTNSSEQQRQTLTLRPLTSGAGSLRPQTAASLATLSNSNAPSPAGASNPDSNPANSVNKENQASALSSGIVERP